MNQRTHLLSVVLLFVGLLLPGTAARAATSAGERGILADLISTALSSPGMQVSVGSVDGALSSDATVRDIVISDIKGPWLKLAEARLIWNRGALFQAQLLIERLEIGKLELLRRPVPTGTDLPRPESPLLPELPVKVVVNSFILGELALGEDIVGTAAHLTAHGHAFLGNPAEGLDLVLDLSRTDQVGTISLKLAFIPKTGGLKLEAAVHEPTGGLLARAGNLPGLPQVDLDVSGDGTLDAFLANISFAAGAETGAHGKIALARQGRERVLTLGLDAQTGILLPAFVAPIFEGVTKISGAVHLGDDGSYSADGVSLLAKAARLDVSGRYAADKSIDGHILLKTDGVPSIQALEFAADVAGSAALPRVSARFLLDGARLPVGQFGHIDAHATILPGGPVSDPATRLDIMVEGHGEGLFPADAGLAGALGDRLDFSLTGKTDLQGEMDVADARLVLRSLEAAYSGHLGREAIKGHASASLPDLTRFAGLTGLKLRGAAKLAADVTGSPAGGQVDALVDLTADTFATGISAVDRLVGGQLALKGGIGTRPGGGLGFSALTLAARNVSGTIEGQATAAAADITASLLIADAARAFPELAGRAEARAHVTGSLRHPDLAATVDITSARAMGRAIPQAVLTLEASDITGPFAARATLRAEVGTKPATGVVEINRVAEKGWRARAHDFAVGAARLSADLQSADGSLIAGNFSVNAPDLDELSPLVLQKLAGSLVADVVLDAASGRQNATIKARALGLRAAGATLRALDANLQVGDLYGIPAIDGSANADGVEVAGEQISRLRATARPSGAGGTDIAINTDFRGMAVEARSTLFAGDRPHLLLQAFSARRGAQAILLAGPSDIAILPRGVSTRGLTLSAGSGRLTLEGSVGEGSVGQGSVGEGSVGEKLDIGINARSLPIGLAGLLMKDPGFDGLLDAQARLTGPARAPVGAWSVKIARLTGTPIRAAGLQPIDVSGAGRFEGGGTSVQASLNLGKAGQVTVGGFAPVDGSSRLDLAVRGTLDAAIANGQLAASGRRVGGRVALDARAVGSIANPRLSGTANLSGGSFVDPLAGVKFDNIIAQVQGQGDAVRILQASATSSNGGRIGLSGTVSALPNAGFPAQIRVTGQNAQLVSNPVVTAVADLALDITGPLLRRPRVSGQVTLQSLDITVPDRFSGASQPLAGAVHVKPTREALALLKIERARKAQAARGPAFNADIDVNVSAPSRIFVRGRGLNAELGGDLRLSGTLDKPVATGAFDMRRGRLDLAFQRLEFSRGKIDFQGDLMPHLDFSAKTLAGDVTAQVDVAGPADKPQFTFSSAPQLPQDEVISRLLFSRASGSLSPFQALQLAATVAELSGQGGPGVLDKLRRSLGVDSVDVNIGPNGQPTIGASRYITKNVNVGVRTGTRPEDSAVTIGVDVSRRIKLQGDMGADGKAAIGVGVEWEY